MAKSSAARRNTFLVFGLFTIAAVLIAAASLFPRNTIPPESPEMAAKRADRQNNGWYLLDELLAQMPPAPTPLWGPLPGDPKMEGYCYKAEPNSLGERLGIDRPDDDPELQRYLASATTIVPRVRDVLAKPYMLLPPEASDPDSENFFSPWGSQYGFKAREVLTLLMAYAFILVDKDPAKSAESARIVRDSLELLDRLYEASIVEHSSGGCFDILTRLNPVDQREWIQWAVKMQSRKRPSREKVEFDLRQHKILLDSLKKHGSITRPVEAAEYVYIRTLFMRNLDLAFKTAWMNYREFQRFVEEEPTLAKYDHAFYGFSYSANVGFNMGWNTILNGSILIAAIELYRHDHGQFPASLNDLIPAYLTALPDDTYAERGVPLLYERTPGGYRLVNHSDSNDKTMFLRTLTSAELNELRSLKNQAEPYLRVISGGIPGRKRD